MSKGHIVASSAVALALAFAFFVLRRDNPAPEEVDSASIASGFERAASNAPRRAQTGDAPETSGKQEAAGKAAQEEMAPEESEEERREAEEERLVEAFDSMVDEYQEPREKGVGVEETRKFLASFAKVPKRRKEECLQRALNLVPDENVMLLAGVLMDPGEDKELVELVFNDILNRDEDVKKVLLERILRTKGHPCRADAAWILDATGQLPGAAKKE